MRLLLACPTCSRQYDVTGHAPGTRFHCSCGTVVKIGEPKARDAVAVRCSSCGGPQQDGATTCQFCGSSLTLNDRDLNTMCPSCFTRISDKARYCHSCGTPIVAETRVGDASERSCPACGDGYHLTSRQIGEMELSVLECGRCAGLWVGVETLRQLERRAKEEAVDVGSLPRPKPVESTTAELTQGGSLYRPCVVCGKLMNRQNYGRRSGVIVDVCGQHGVWFDDQELAQVLRWVRQTGGQENQTQTVLQDEETLARLRERSRLEAAAGPRRIEPMPFERQEEDFLSDLGTLLVRAFFG